MNRLLFYILPAFMWLSLCGARGQDRIVTVTDDTIRCRILSVTKKVIRYELLDDENAETVMPLTRVAEYRFGSAHTGTKISQATARTVETQRPMPVYARWQAGIRGGGSYLTGSTSQAEKEMEHTLGVPSAQSRRFYRQLKMGYHTGGELYYLFHPLFGAGAKYLFFASQAGGDAMSIRTENYMYTVLYPKDNVYVNYVAPALSMRQWLNKPRTLRLTEEVSAGCAFLRDETRFGAPYYPQLNNLLFNGKTFAGTVGYTFAWHPTNRLSAGVYAELFYAVFKQLEIRNETEVITQRLDKDHYENYSRIDFGLRIQFHW